MTGPSVTSRTLTALFALLMVAGVASAASGAAEIDRQAQALEDEAGALSELDGTVPQDAGEDAEASTVAEIGDALAAAGEAIADAARATVGAIGTAAGTVASGLASVAAAIGDGLVAVGVALGDATLWTGEMLWTGLVATGDGLAWVGAGVWAGVTGVASGLWWLTERTGEGIAWTAIHLGQGVGTVAVWLGETIAGGVLAAGEAWPSDPTHQAIVASSAGGTAAAAGAAWYTRAWRYLKYAPGLAPLYTRISRDELLDHPKRAKIYETIEASPGIHLSEMARELDLSWGTLLHHLRKLEDADLVTSEETSGKRCFFLPGQVSSAERDILPALENEKARRIAEFYAEHPGASQTEAAEALNLSAALVSWHLNKLEEAGVVTRERVGRRQRVGVTQEAQAVVAA